MQNKEYKENIGDGLKEYYANESKGFAIGFANWLGREYIGAEFNNQAVWYKYFNDIEEIDKDSKGYTTEELYDIYIKQMK